MSTLLRIALLLAVLTAAVALFAVLPVQATPPDRVAGPQPEATHPTPSLFVSPNERIGVGLVYGIADITTYDVSLIEAGWYGDWFSRRYPPHPNGMDYLPLVPLGAASWPPNWSLLSEQARLNPGQTWIIGNESEGYWQERLTPALYAERFHQVCSFLKTEDPTALCAITGVILPSPLRLQWLDLVLQEYQTRYGVPMPVDVWNMHAQMVQEVSCAYAPERCYGAEIPTGITATEGMTMSLADNASVDLFIQLLRGMRTWMQQRGFQDKPLIISEYGVLYPSDYLSDTVEMGDLVVASFMTRTFEYMLYTTDQQIGMPADGYRLAQRWMWYTLNDQPYNFETSQGFNGGLFDWQNKTYPGALTYFGQVFRNYVVPLKTPYRDVHPVGITSSPGCGVASVTVKVANKGNTPASNVYVRLFAGDPNAGGVQVGSDRAAPQVGIRHAAPGTATFAWAIPPGVTQQTFYAIVDPANALPEADETNNAASFTVPVNAHAGCIMLPLIVSNR